MTDSQEDPVSRTPVPGSSMMDALRSKYVALGKATTIDLDLPGYEGVLIARYHVLDVQNDINKIAVRVQQEFKSPMEQGLFGSIDTMIAACDGLYSKKEEELVALGDDPFFAHLDNPPVKFDHNLVDYMGWEDFNKEKLGARDVVLRLFQNVEPMLLKHGQVLSVWMTDVTRKTQSAFVGGL